MKLDSSKAREKQRRKATAFHEAGHAVISVIQRRRFKHVTIKPDGEALGHVRGDMAVIRRRLRLHAEGYIDVAEVCINVTGAVAERRLTGRNNHRGAHSDYQNAVDVARGMGDDGCGGPENAPMVKAIVQGAFEHAPAGA